MSSLEGVDRMFSVAAPQVRGKSAQDNIFAANNRAVALADKIGKDKVINGTVGSILDEDGNLVELEVVKEAYARLTPRQISSSSSTFYNLGRNFLAGVEYKF